MANGFSVTISAVDAASAKIDAINKKIAGMQAPALRVQKSLAKFGDVTGITALGRGMGNLGRMSLDAFRSLSRIIAPLGAITGAVSIAGMARLVTTWGAFGERLNIAAQRTGIAASQLQALQNGARLAGASAEAMTSGLRTLTDTLTNAVGGRAPEAVVMMNTLGISFRDAAGNARSTTEVLPELADKIAAIKNPTLQARVAVALLGAAGEELLPYLRRGAKGMAEYAAEARHFGVMNDTATAAAQQLAREQHRLELSVDGLGLSIGEALAPVLGPVLHDMAEWIAANRTWLATTIAKDVKELVGYVKEFVTDANDAAKAVGGWKVVGEIVLAWYVGKFAVGMIASFVRIATSAIATTRAIGLMSTAGGAGAGTGALGLGLTTASALALPLALSGDTADNPEAKAAMAALIARQTEEYRLRKAAEQRGPLFNPSAPNGVPGAGPRFGPSVVQQPPDSGNRDEFVRKYGAAAAQAGQRTGVDPRIILAQAALESDWGRKAPNNNMFGIKGPGSAQTTREFANGQWITTQANFSRYQSKEDSFAGYAEFILNNPRYQAFRQAQGLTEQGAELTKSGYATAPGYGGIVAGIAQSFPANIGGGAGASPNQVNHTVNGNADVNIRLSGSGAANATAGVSSSGDLFTRPPRVERAMSPWYE